MSLLVLHTPLDWAFISVQVFVLSLDGWFDALSRKFIICDISLLCYYTNLNLSINCCAFSEDIHLSCGISISFLASTFWKLISFEDFEGLVISSAILLPIKSPAASAVF